VTSELTANPASDGQLFDALTIRRVLMYLLNPEATLKRLVEYLKPGGKIIIQEHDFGYLDGVLNQKSFPLHEKLLRGCWAAAAGAGRS
jgi:2-polyprenyl-3-methyl-5-hydroxy-6-metoxy-1,4-benzoquinol methylase